MARTQFAEIPVVILAGGRPILYDDKCKGRLNKALVPVNDRPLFWWNLLHYAKYGVRDFVIAVGVQAEGLVSALADLGAAAVNGEKNTYSLNFADIACSVKLVFTDPHANTSQRVLACKPHLEHAQTFCLTYSDTLSDVNLNEELIFHQMTGLIATVVAAQMPVRFRVLGIRHSDYLVRAFAPKPVIQAVPINGGYYFFEKAFLAERYLGNGESPLEQEPLERLALDLQLGAFEHRGAWQHLDGERDLPHLEAVAEIISSAVY